MASKKLSPRISIMSQNFVGVQRRRCWTKCSEVDKRLIVAVAVLSVLFCSFFTAFLVAHHDYFNLLGRNPCMTNECIESSAILLEIVNFSQKPCEDFYEFACGKFDNVRPINEIIKANSWFLEKQHALIEVVKEVLESDISATDLKPVNQAKQFYKACTNTSEIEKVGLTPLYKILEMLELPKTVPTSETAGEFNLGKTLALAQRHLNLDILIVLSSDKGPVKLNVSSPKNGTVIKIYPDVVNPDKYGSDSNRSIQRKETVDKKREKSKIIGKEEIEPAVVEFTTNVMREILKDLEKNQTENPNAYNASEVESFASETIQLEMQLAEQSSENMTNPKNSEIHTTFSAFQAVLDDVGGIKASTNRIEWKEYVTTLFEKSNKTYDLETDTVVVENAERFKHISNILGEVKPELVQRFVWWQVVKSLARHTTASMRGFYAKLLQDLSRESHELPRSISCTSRIKEYMNVAVAHEMAKKNDFSSSFSKVREMLDDIIIVFGYQIESLDWMDLATKELTRDKVKSVSNEIGYTKWITEAGKIEEYYKDFNLEESDFLLNIVRVKELELKNFLMSIGPDSETDRNKTYNKFWLEVNAFYICERNFIGIPAGILQQPFYFRGLESLNYGALGSILGHELMHGFDTNGKNYNKFGEKRLGLWPEKTEKEYLNRTQCFVDQYEKHDISRNKSLNDHFTLNENIADNGGLRQSYRAYQRYLSRHSREPSLPGFQNFTNDQLFFLSYASVFCEVSAVKFDQFMRTIDSHSNGRVRVTAALQNMKEFAEAFNCPPKSFMNPEKKCVIW